MPAGPPLGPLVGSRAAGRAGTPLPLPAEDERSQVEHERWLSPEHDLLTLRDLVPLYLQDLGYADWTSSGWRSKCAGYAVRRLSGEQFAYYWASVQAAHAALSGGLR